MIRQAKFTYSPLGKAFKKQIKTIQDQGEKQVKALGNLKPKSKSKSIEEIFPEGYESVEIKNKVHKIKQYERNVNRNNMIYYSSKELFSFYVFKTIWSFVENIYSGKVTIKEADQEQADLLEYLLNFINVARPEKRMTKKTK